MKELREDFKDFSQNDPVAGAVLDLLYLLVKMLGYGLVLVLMIAPAAALYMAALRAGLPGPVVVVGFFIGHIPGVVGFMLFRFLRHRRNMRDPNYVPPDRSYHEW